LEEITVVRIEMKEITFILILRTTSVLIAVEAFLIVRGFKML
jgi:hypothetical protein